MEDFDPGRPAEVVNAGTAVDPIYSFQKGIELARFTRFGRRINIPSSLQIRTELRALVADENARERCAEAEGLANSASWEVIIEHRRRPVVTASGERI